MRGKGGEGWRVGVVSTSYAKSTEKADEAGGFLVVLVLPPLHVLGRFVPDEGGSGQVPKIERQLGWSMGVDVSCAYAAV